MPASSPPVDTAALATLTKLGNRIRARREELGLTMNQTAEAAGVSRVTVHRIERGTPSVTMGAYLTVITALSLSLDLIPSSSAATVRVDDYPQLRLIAWQLGDDTEISEADALQLYERNWRHIDHAVLQPRERLFMQHLADTWGHGRLLV
jgi:transcriptional regulator with XRE-family HTH domain